MARNCCRPIYQEVVNLRWLPLYSRHRWDSDIQIPPSSTIHHSNVGHRLPSEPVPLRSFSNCTPLQSPCISREGCPGFRSETRKQRLRLSPVPERIRTPLRYRFPDLRRPTQAWDSEALMVSLRLGRTFRVPASDSGRLPIRLWYDRPRPTSTSPVPTVTQTRTTQTR